MSTDHRDQGRGGRQRKLGVESLESRKLLHGGGMLGEALENVVSGLFESLDGNADGQLAADEVSEKAWTQLSGADADESGGVSQEELLTLLQAKLAEQRPHFGGRPGFGHGGHHSGGATIEERVATLFESAGEDGLLSEDEVSARVWTRISAADTDGDSLISQDELTAKLEAEAAERLTKFIDKVFEADENGDGLTADEVSQRKWARLALADADGDAVVTQDEFRAYLEAKQNGSTTDNGTGTEDTSQTTTTLAATTTSSASSFVRSRGYGRGR